MSDRVDRSLDGRANGVLDRMSIKGLLDKAAAKHGTTSVQKLAKIARDGNFRTNHTTIAAIRAGTYPARPSRQTLDALAYLAGVPNEIAYAAGGLHNAADKPFAEQLPRDVDLLTPSQRGVALAVIRAFIDAQMELSKESSDA